MSLENAYTNSFPDNVSTEVDRWAITVETPPLVDPPSCTYSFSDPSTAGVAFPIIIVFKSAGGYIYNQQGEYSTVGGVTTVQVIATF